MRPKPYEVQADLVNPAYRAIDNVTGGIIVAP
jgi:hypothetical protein